MAIAKRVALFLLTNFLVIMTLGIIMRVFGLGNYVGRFGIDYTSLAVFCLVWGMGGSIISLLLSKFIAKRMMGVQVIDPKTSDPRLRALVETIHGMAKVSGISRAPEVGIYQSPEPNAFATGPSKNNSLVAVSTGLLETMSADEVEGVLGHEMAHISNGDMVTMTLLQGVVNAFVLFLARALAYAISNALSRDRDGEGVSFMARFAIQIVLEIVFMILGSIVVAWFSRYREYRADAGGARLAGRDKMVRALEALQRMTSRINPEVERQQAAMASFKISTRPHGSFMMLFASHPPLSSRISALQSI